LRRYSWMGIKTVRYRRNPRLVPIPRTAGNEMTLSLSLDDDDDDDTLSFIKMDRSNQTRVQTTGQSWRGKKEGGYTRGGSSLGATLEISVSPATNLSTYRSRRKNEPSRPSPPTKSRRGPETSCAFATSCWRRKQASKLREPRGSPAYGISSGMN